MSKVSLRVYNREIEGLIAQGHRLDEAVAHCRHILTTFPKHLDTYRLLGKAHLEAKQYDQAVDIFQRVLVAAPEDFVSHVGMSIIADDRGKLDEAIWHMERAFEVQPSNAAIQAELQRLFGRRDGVEPPKIRLTRGALAHMYVHGELYTQAISEIRAVLANDQHRTDMQVLLARAYFKNGQKAETAEVCTALLAISPYCLDANRLLAEISPDGNLTDAAREYRRRVSEMDPYAEFAQGSVFNSDAVPDGAVSLLRLDYTEAVSDTGSIAAVGLDTTWPAVDSTASPPSWLRSTSAEDAAAQMALQGSEDIPDFLRGAAHRTVSSTQEVAPGEADEDLEAEPAVSPGDLPEWVKALAPAEDAQGEPPPHVSEWQAADLHRDFEGSRFAVSPPRAEPLENESETDWLRELAHNAEEAAKAHADTAAGRQQDKSTSFSQTDGSGGTPPEQADAVAWFEGLTEKPSAKPGKPTGGPESPSAERLERIRRTMDGGATPPEGWEPVHEDLESTEQPVDTQEASATDATPDGRLDWLRELSDQDAFKGIAEQIGADEASILEEGEVADWPQPGEKAQAGDLPDWLGPAAESAGRTGSPGSRDPSGEYEATVNLPDWLAGLDADRSPTAGAALQEASEPSLPEWLQSEADAKPEPAQREAPIPVPKPDPGRTTAEGGSPKPTPAEPEPALSMPDALPPKTTSARAGAAVVTPSLASARAELGRGNIAVALEQYGRLIRKGRALEDIIRDLREALYRYPVEVPIWQALGDAYMRANRLQEALDAYTKAEELLR